MPAGIVFVGGGANTLGLENFSKNGLRLPSTVGGTELFGNQRTKLRDPSWFTALGLIVGGKYGDSSNSNSLTSIFRDLKNTINRSLKQLMP